MRRRIPPGVSGVTSARNPMMMSTHPVTFLKRESVLDVDTGSVM
jgi:hypothetical protein